MTNPSRQQRRAMAREKQKDARHRRKTAAMAAAIGFAKNQAKADVHRFKLLGLTDARADCSATAFITLHPDGRATSDVWHDEHCPAANGAVPWRVVA